MTTSCFHRSARLLLVSLMLPLVGCAAGGTPSGPSVTGTPPAESRQSAVPERKDKQPQAAGNKKPDQTRAPIDETSSGPPTPVKPPAIGGSGG